MHAGETYLPCVNFTPIHPASRNLVRTDYAERYRGSPLRGYSVVRVVAMETASRDLCTGVATAVRAPVAASTL